MGDYKFINPYNFVPLGKGPKRTELNNETGDLSGVIEYSVRTRTPLFIPDSSKASALHSNLKGADKGHKSYEFYSYPSEKSPERSAPVIPGSEMRGMLRCYYEILTDSCLSGIDLGIRLNPKEKKRTDISENIADYKSCDKMKISDEAETSDEMKAIKVCDACKLFGMIGQKSITSRIRVADLTCVQKDGNWYDAITTLDILSTPKPGTTEFYLKRPANNAVYWTYNSYIDDQDKEHKNVPILINGRKFYWHHDVKKGPGPERTKLNMSIRPVKEGIKFDGKIFFNHLTKEELDGLCFLLKQDENHAYKLGAAKPLGYGSITVTLKGVYLHKYSVNAETKTIDRTGKVKYTYEKVSNADWKESDFDEITKFIRRNNADYPRIKRNGPIVKWFDENDRDNEFAEYMEAMRPELRLRLNKDNRKKDTEHKSVHSDGGFSNNPFVDFFKSM